MATVKLTAKQSDILKDRLSHASEIAGRLEESVGCDATMTEEVALALLAGTTKAKLDTAKADAIDSDIARHVLAECIEGSTWTDYRGGEGGDYRRGAIGAVTRLSDKLEKVVGRHMIVPGGWEDHCRKNGLV